MKRCISTEYNDTEFKELLTSVVKEVLQQSLSQLIPHIANSPPDQSSDKLLNRNEVCKCLRISLPTLSKLQEESKIKAIIVGSRYKYSSKHIHEIMNGTKKK